MKIMTLEEVVPESDISILHWSILPERMQLMLSSKIWVQKQANKQTKMRWMGKINNKNKIGHIFFQGVFVKQIKNTKMPSNHLTKKPHDLTAA